MLVPPGTMIKDENGHIIADLDDINKEVIICLGGEGGKGNKSFATATKQVPRFAERGLPGEEKLIILELKILADVGIIGFPNAGKSTLLSVISAAKPKIGNYPFTTIEPKVGIVKLSELDSFVAADMPGLIEDASQGCGLGSLFLKHIERTKILWHLIEVEPFDEIIERFNKINYELKKFTDKLANKEQIIVISKIDLLENHDTTKIIEYFENSGYKVFCISSTTKKSINELLGYSFSRIKHINKTIVKVEFDDEFMEYKMKEKKDNKAIKLNENEYLITGDDVERFVLKLNFKYDEAVFKLHKYLKENNLIEKLKKLGIEENDTVKIADIEFYFKEDN